MSASAAPGSKLSCSTTAPPCVSNAGSALAEPNDQNSGTASHTRSAAVRCMRSPMSKPLAMTGPCARVTPLGAAVEPEV